jgi:hypothetical protein
MKMIYFLLLTMTSAVLAGGIGHAASMPPNPSQAGADNAPATTTNSARPAETAPNARGAEKTRPHIPASAAKPARLAHAPAHAQSSVAANHGSMQNEAIYRALPVRSGSVVRPATPSASTVRHRDPNAAVIGGAASPNRRSMASLDGSRTNLASRRN